LLQLSSYKPLEWTSNHQTGAAAPQAPCLPLHRPRIRDPKQASRISFQQLPGPGKTRTTPRRMNIGKWRKKSKNKKKMMMTIEKANL
jgi:hypothetical protein